MEVRVSDGRGMVEAVRDTVSKHWKPLLAIAIVVAALIVMLGIHELNGWAGPWGTIEWLHMKLPLGSMVRLMAVLSPNKWCWG